MSSTLRVTPEEYAELQRALTALYRARDNSNAGSRKKRQQAGAEVITRPRAQKLRFALDDCIVSAGRTIDLSVSEYQLSELQLGLNYIQANRAAARKWHQTHGTVGKSRRLKPILDLNEKMVAV